MPGVANQSALAPTTELIVSEMKTVFDNAGVSNADERVFGDDGVYEDFPHALVVLPEESRSTYAEDKGHATMVDFPQAQIYAVGSSGYEYVLDYADRLIERVTDPGLSVSGWDLIRADVQFNTRATEVGADQRPIHSRTVQFEIHLEPTS